LLSVLRSDKDLLAMIFQCPDLDSKEREVIGRVAELKRLLVV